jgi:hypothetical protein
LKKNIFPAIFASDQATQTEQNLVIIEKYKDIGKN